MDLFTTAGKNHRYASGELPRVGDLVAYRRGDVEHRPGTWRVVTVEVRQYWSALTVARVGVSRKVERSEVGPYRLVVQQGAHDAPTAGLPQLEMFAPLLIVGAAVLWGRSVAASMPGVRS